MIKSFEEACDLLNIEKHLPDVSMLPEKHQNAVHAHYKLVVIAQALNEGWEPNWSDYNELKYYPWFDMETYEGQPPASGFSYYVFGFVFTGAALGSRLVFKTSELAEYAGKQFLDIYQESYLISK